MSSRGLRDLLQAEAPLLAPGCWDAFTALMIERAGFPSAYLSGASMAYMRLARPDIGLLGLDDVVGVAGNITERIDIPLIVDLDAGHGNALNVRRAVRLIERAGAAAIQLEDQSSPKRCGHLVGKSLVSIGEMRGKIQAAIDARRDPGILIIARTDAIAVEGLGRALERAEAYLAAGCDVLFVEAPDTREQLKIVADRFATRVPLMANMVEGGRTPLASLSELGDLGFRLVIFPGALARAFGFMAGRFLTGLKAHGTTEPLREQMLDFQGLNDVVGTAAMLDLGQRYDSGG